MTEMTNWQARCLVETMKIELESLADTDPVKGYAAEDEIREALPHLEAAMADLDSAIDNE